MITTKMDVAVRVLIATTKGERPAEQDIALLRSYCPEDGVFKPELAACLVIERELKANRLRVLPRHAGRSVSRGYFDP
jgi:hypothetical protein